MTSVLSISMPTSGKTKTKGTRITAKTRKQQKLTQDNEKKEVISSIKEVEQALKQAYACFNEVTDPDLVDCYIYEINALKSQHNYLTRRLRIS